MSLHPETIKQHPVWTKVEGAKGWVEEVDGVTYDCRLSNSVEEPELVTFLHDALMRAQDVPPEMPMNNLIYLAPSTISYALVFTGEAGEEEAMSIRARFIEFEDGRCKGLSESDWNHLRSLLDDWMQGQNPTREALPEVQPRNFKVNIVKEV